MPRTRRFPRPLLMLALAVLAGAAFVSAEFEWHFNVTPSGVPTAASYGDGLVTLAVNNRVHLIRSVGAASGPAAQPLLIGGTANPPLLDRVHDGPNHSERWYVWVTTQDGFLRKIDVAASLAAPASPLQIAQSAGVPQIRDMRRAGCSTDSIVSAPVVQRRDDSNAAFTVPTDIVIVATSYGCGETIQNQVIALDAHDITAPPIWVFNSGEFEVGTITSCLLDPRLNRVHCGSEFPAGNTQWGLWSIDTNTGTLAWVGLLGASVRARPALGTLASGERRLYAAERSGLIHAFDPDDGTDVSSITVSGPAPRDITQDLATGSGDYAGAVFATAHNGRVTAFFDVGNELVEAWEHQSLGGQKVVTAPIVFPSLHRLFVGRQDSVFVQVHLSSGSEEARGSFPVVPGEITTSVALTGYRGWDGGDRVIGAVRPVAFAFRQFRVACEIGSITCTFADGDTIPEASDNCPYVANQTQADSDGDGIGNACDGCPAAGATPQNDFDHDGIWDSCDTDADNDGASNELEVGAGTNLFDPDSDDDGYPDGVEFQAGSDPLSAFSTPAIYLKSLTLATAETAGCKNVSATLTLNVPAPAGGIVVNVWDTLAGASAPASVSIAAGAVTKKFTIPTSPVTSPESGTVRAEHWGTKTKAFLTVRPVGVSAVKLSPATVVGGKPSTGTVTLECAAGPGPLTVHLSSNRPAVAAPAAPTVLVATGSKTATFAVNTNPVLIKTSATVSASLNGLTKSKALNVTSAASISPTSLKFGSVAVGSTSGALVATLTNKGASPFAVTSIALTGASASWFGAVNDCGASLAAGASCAITVTFTPAAVASRSAKVQVTTGATATPLLVSVSGQGVAP